MLAKRSKTPLQTSLGRAHLPALAVVLLFDDLRLVRSPAYRHAAYLLPGLLHRDERVLEPGLQLPHDPVPVYLGATGDLLSVALRPVYDLSGPTLRTPVEFCLGDHRVSLVVGFLDYALGLLLGRSNRGPAFPAERLGLRQLWGQGSP